METHQKHLIPIVAGRRGLNTRPQTIYKNVCCLYEAHVLEHNIIM